MLGPLVVVIATAALAVSVVNWAMTHVRSPAPHSNAAALAGDGYALWDLRSDGSPVRWDPCTPVTWTTRPSDPPWVRTVTGDALATLSATTGLAFAFVPSSDDAVGSTRPLTNGQGDWNPVLVTLTTPEESQWLVEADRALALPVMVDGQFVSAQILLQVGEPLSTDVTTRDGSWGAALMHEWGHVVGLDHVDNHAQLMHDVALPGPAAWAAGDLRGLHRLGADTTCLSAPPAREGDLPAPRRR